MASKRSERDGIKLLYEKKFKYGEYGKKSVFLSKNPDHYHHKIIKIVKELNKKKLNILDVGCATGYLSAVFKEEGNFVCGIEISETAAQEAKKVLDDVIVGDVEEVDIPYPENFFDVIICSDILEHLFDPKRVLIKLKKFLRKDGLMLVVLPNIAHYTIRVSLLRGKWIYQNSGILDIGHLRFFTKDSAVKLFKESGYLVVKIIPYLEVPRILRYLNKNKIINKILQYFDTLFAYTYLFVLKPAGDSNG